MRILLLLDKNAQTKKHRVSKALNRVKATYEGVTDVTWEYENHIYEGVGWTRYLPGSLGLDPAHLNTVTKELRGRHGSDYDHVIFCVDPSNWQDGEHKIGGWALTFPKNGYYVQIVKVSNSDEWLYKIFAMEIFHTMDDIARDELGVNLNKVTGLDFDYDIVHGEHPDYGVEDSRSHTGYFTNYEYREIILEFKDYISEAYEKRLHKNMKDKIAMLQTIVSILRTLVKIKAEPFTFGPHTHMKPLYTSRTFWFAMAQAIAGGSVILFTQLDMVGYATMVKSVADVMLRWVTTQPVKLK